MESAPQPQATPPLLHDRYRILTKLGITRLAVVYRASDERLHRQVLVHMLRPEHQQQGGLRQRFLDEAQSRARRHHPALLEIFDSGEVSDRPYLVTEEPAGQRLAEALPLGALLALRTLRQLVGAIQSCREGNSPLPPISSKAIILSEHQRAVLVEPWWLSADELALEQAHYRAPERTLGAPPSEATLVYSLGILAYELFSGRRPFQGTSPQEIAQQHLHQELPPAITLVPGFAPRFAQVLARATERRPEDRTPDLLTLARDLAALEASTDSPTQPLAAPPRPLRQAVRETLKPVTGALRRPPQVAHAAPPPPPMWQPPAPAFRPGPPAPQPRPADMRREIQREVKREMRRGGCRRFLARRIVGLVFILGLIGGCAWSVTFGLNWYRDGHARVECATRQLPDFVCNLLPSAGRTLKVNREGLNLRSEPGTASEVLGVLKAGDRVERRGDPQVDAAGISWLPVTAEINGVRLDGWCSYDLLLQE
jgi:hypothetical protein